MFRRLLQLNGLAITAVVLFHAVGMGFVAMFAWADRYLPPTVSPAEQIGSLSYYALRIGEQLVVFSIPAFLFVSGFFIAVATGKSQPTVSWKTVLARIKGLLIPYLIWSAVVLALLFVQGERFSIRGILVKLLTGSSNEVLYYVPLLVQFYLLSPFLVKFAKSNWKLLLLMAGLIQLGVQLMAYPVFLGLDIPNQQVIVNLVPKWFFPTRIFWFSLGIVFGFHIEQFKQSLAKYRWLLLGVTLLCIPIGILEWEQYFRLSGRAWLDHRETLIDTVYALGFLLTFFAFSQSSLPFSVRFEQLGQRSYGIYLIHSIAIEYTAKIIYHLTPWLLGYQILFLPIMIAVGLGAPLVLMAIVDRSPVRRYYKYLFG